MSLSHSSSSCENSSPISTLPSRTSLRPTIKQLPPQVQDAPDGIIIDQAARLSKPLSSLTNMDSLYDAAGQAAWRVDISVMNAGQAAGRVVAELQRRGILNMNQQALSTCDDL